MEQGDEFGPAFETAQLCRSSGNSAQCINAIEDYAKEYSEGQVESNNPRRVQFQTDQDTRYGYDPNVIDHAFIAGKSKPLDRNMTLRNPSNSSEMITIELPKIRKQEEPSLHQNKSINYNQAFPVKNTNYDLEMEQIEEDQEEEENKRKQEEEKRKQEEEKKRRAVLKNRIQMQLQKPEPNYVNISDVNKNTYAFLLFIGIFVPLVFILFVIVLENIPKR